MTRNRYAAVLQAVGLAGMFATLAVVAGWWSLVAVASFVTMIAGMAIERGLLDDPPS